MNMHSFLKFSFENNIADVPVPGYCPYAPEQAGFVLMNCEVLREDRKSAVEGLEEEDVFPVRATIRI